MVVGPDNNKSSFTGLSPQESERLLKKLASRVSITSSRLAQYVDFKSHLELIEDIAGNDKKKVTKLLER